MTEKSRTEYSARNTTIAMVSRIIAIVMGYLARVVFTHTLSESYVGINGLFTDILNVLALSELGIGTAITYALYRPVAEKDIERQKSVMKLYQGLYRLVALLIAAAGLLVVPFLGYFVHDAYDVDHILLIYLLYLANSVLSYLFVYKKTLVDAHQLNYIGVLYHTVFLVIQYVFQMVLLAATRNFILYLLTYLLCTAANNICIARKADSLYPYLRDENIEPLPREEKKKLIKNIKAMLLHKIGAVVVNNTDNLLLSVMVGIISVGKYANYYLVIGSVRQVLDQAFQGITASVGNLGVTENRERVRTIFESSFFVGQWMYGFASICLFQLLNQFVAVSFGEKYVFPSTLVFVLCLNFFVTGMRQAALIFRDSLGLFWFDRYKPLAEAAVNLTASIFLTLRFGIIGVFLGTFISTMFTSFWIEPYVLYQKRLKSPVAPYFLRYAVYSGVVFAAGFLTHTACTPVRGAGFPAFLARAFICVTVPNLLFLLCYHKTREFRFLWRKLMGLLRRKRGSAPENGGRELDVMDRTLLEILRDALAGEGPSTRRELTEEEWRTLVQKADRHAVLSLLYDTLNERPLPKNQREIVTRASRRIVLQNYRLSFCTHRAVELLKGQGISTVVLKGVSAAAVYPVPELRKSGDIDLLLPDPGQMSLARDTLLKAGYTAAEHQMSNHHLVMHFDSGIELELHTMLAEPFDNAKINHYLRGCLREISGHIEQRDVMGYEIPVLSEGYQAYQLLLHMLQHFLRSGFGLKLLCDWFFFWSRPVAEDELRLYLKLVEESGLSGFSRLVTSICVRYLGLDGDCCLCGRMDGLMEEAEMRGFVGDILEAEEFGKSGKDRMVRLRGTSLWDYVREFHHMMHLNYPRAGKVFLLWPVLWCITLLRFLKNNRKIRGVTTGEVLKKARERSSRMEQLELFKTQGGNTRLFGGNPTAGTGTQHKEK